MECMRAHVRTATPAAQRRTRGQEEVDAPPMMAWLICTAETRGVRFCLGKLGHGAAPRGSPP